MYTLVCLPMYPGGMYTLYMPPLLYTPGYTLPSHRQRCTPGYTVTSVCGAGREAPGLKKGKKAWVRASFFP